MSAATVLQNQVAVQARELNIALNDILPQINTLGLAVETDRILTMKRMIDRLTDLAAPSQAASASVKDVVKARDQLVSRLLTGMPVAVKGESADEAIHETLLAVENFLKIGWAHFNARQGVTQ